MNCLFLIVISELVTTYSEWNTDPTDRFTYGLIFDVILVLHFLFNIVFVIVQLVPLLSLKLKQMKFRHKNRKRHPIYTYKAKIEAPPILEKDEPLAQQEENIFIRDETAENLENELIDLEKQEEIQRKQ